MDMVGDYANIGPDNIVTTVIVATPQVISTYPGTWVRTYQGADGDCTLGCNYAGKGYSYDPVKNVFYAPQPYPSWSLNSKYQWVAPVPYPDDGRVYRWDETSRVWVQLNIPQ